MAENREPDVALTRFVGQFRRCARLAAADPLRLLPPDPTVRARSLAAAVAALIEVAPFEPLRRTIASAAPDGRADVVRARVQPFAQGARRARPQAAPDVSGRAAHASAARAAGTPASRHSAPLPQVAGARATHEHARSDTSSPSTLAERRRALRRDARLGSTTAPSPLAAALAAVAATTTPDVVPRRPAGSSTSRAAVRVADATPAPHQLRAEASRRRLLPPSAALAAVRASASEAAPAEDASRHISEDAAGLVGAGAATAGAPGVAAIGMATRAPFDEDAALHEQRNTVAASRVWPPPAVADGASPDGALAPSLPPRRGESLADVDPIRRSRSADRDARLGFADDLFEVLYREGVDLSWP
jgi:hypothetical protein